MKQKKDIKKQLHKVEAIDGMLRQIPHIEDKINETSEKIEQCNAMLEAGCVSSVIPKVSKKNVNHSNRSIHESMILEKAALEEEHAALLLKKESIESEIKNLPEHQQAMIRMRYTEHRTYDCYVTALVKSYDENSEIYS